MDYKIKIPKQAQMIISTLEDNGYDSYIVGGCVRDSIIGKEPNDFDITTNAKPDVVLNLFDKAIPTGIEHGTITVILDNENFEITTYRTEGKYIDNRHPSEVNFVLDLKEDLSRRDFTINAMAYNKKDNLKDYFGGIEDLNNKIIRTVGDPRERFNEDALRMIRAVRFSSQLDFKIEDKTLNAIKELSTNLEKISKERIREEFNKILKSNPKYIDILKDTKLLYYIIPEFYEVICDKSKMNLQEYKELLLGISLVEDKVYLRLSMMFSKIINLKTSEYKIDFVKDSLKFLKYDNLTINNVVSLVQYSNFDIKSDYDIKKMLNVLGENLFRDLLKLKRADILSKSSEDLNIKLLELDKINKNLDRIINLNECYSLKSLKINGKDLINLGIVKGNKIGLILNYLLDEVMKDNKLNEKEILSKLVTNKLINKI